MAIRLLVVSATNRLLVPKAFWIEKAVVELVGFWKVLLLETVTVVPSSEMLELAMAWEALNLASLLVVPPAVVTPVPDPAQLPTVVQMV